MGGMKMIFSVCLTANAVVATNNIRGEAPLRCNCSCEGNSSALCGGPHGKGSCTGKCKCDLDRFCNNGCFIPKTETEESCLEYESTVEYLQRIRWVSRWTSSAFTRMSRNTRTATCRRTHEKMTTWKKTSRLYDLCHRVRTCFWVLFEN